MFKKKIFLLFLVVEIIDFIVAKPAVYNSIDIDPMAINPDDDDVDSFIVNGEDTEFGKYPYYGR